MAERLAGLRGAALAAARPSRVAFPWEMLSPALLNDTMPPTRLQPDVWIPPLAPLLSVWVTRRRLRWVLHRPRLRAGLACVGLAREVAHLPGALRWAEPLYRITE